MNLPYRKKAPDGGKLAKIYEKIRGSSTVNSAAEVAKVGIFTYLLGHFTDSGKDRREEQGKDEQTNDGHRVGTRSGRREANEGLFFPQIRNRATRDA